MIDKYEEEILSRVSAKHAAEWLVQNRTAWKLAQEVLRLRGDLKFLQELLLEQEKHNE